MENALKRGVAITFIINEEEARRNTSAAFAVDRLRKCMHAAKDRVNVERSRIIPTRARSLNHVNSEAGRLGIGSRRSHRAKLFYLAPSFAFGPQI